MALVQFKLSSIRNEISAPRFAPMLIHIIALNSSRFTVPIEPEETIYDLKWQLAVTENINPGHYILLLGGETLYHEQTLKHYEIFSGCTLHMGAAFGSLNTSTVESWAPITVWVNVVGTGEKLKVMAHQGSTTVRSVKRYVSGYFGLEARGSVISRREGWRPLDECGTLWNHQIWDETSLYIKSQRRKLVERSEYRTCPRAVSC